MSNLSALREPFEVVVVAFNISTAMTLPWRMTRAQPRSSVVELVPGDSVAPIKALAGPDSPVALAVMRELWERTTLF